MLLNDFPFCSVVCTRYSTTLFGSTFNKFTVTYFELSNTSSRLSLSPQTAYCEVLLVFFTGHWSVHLHPVQLVSQFIWREGGTSPAINHIVDHFHNNITVVFQQSPIKVEFDHIFWNQFLFSFSYRKASWLVVVWTDSLSQSPMVSLRGLLQSWVYLRS